MGPDSKYVKYLDGTMQGVLVLAWLTCAVMFVALLVYRPAQVSEAGYFWTGVGTLAPLFWVIFRKPITHYLERE